MSTDRDAPRYVVFSNTLSPLPSYFLIYYSSCSRKPSAYVSSSMWDTKYHYLLTYSMDQSPSWEANWFAASQEIPRILWNPKIHYRIHKCPPPARVLSENYLTPDPNSWKSILILSSHLRLVLPCGLFPSGFPTKTLNTPLLSPHNF